MYENVVQALYQALLLYEGYDNIKVQHNVTLPCESGATVQFDIFWEFKLAGVHHRVAVECKNYNRTVSVGDVHEFAHKLQCVGNLIGIMVTRKGYQDGAIKTARFSGIYLKKFQLPADMNWNGKIRRVILSIHILTLENIQRNYVPDRQWISEYLKDNNVFTLHVNAPSDEIFLIDEEGNVIKTLCDLDNELPRGEHSATALKHSFPMHGKVFLRLPDSQEFLLDSINYQYDVLDTVEEVSLSADTILQGLLSDIDGQESFLFFLDHTIINTKER